MLEELLQQLPSLGVAGLLFVMWWHERQERLRSGVLTTAAQMRSEQVLGINDHLLDVIRGNTEALVALREELRAYRETQTAWMNRLAGQIEKLKCA
ncbi:MAG: hypothetical protein ABIG44_01375 [Planctomycetota bacterium]